MELKYFIVLSIVGVAAAFTVPTGEGQVGGVSSDLEASFPASSTDVDPSSTLSRDKRGLLFKKLKKHGSDTMYVNRRYESSSGAAAYRPGREVHHHHYSTYPNPPVVQQPYQPYPAPSNDYHHYHGASGYQHGGYYASEGGNYYNGGGYSAGGGAGYYSRPNYGDGGYAHYGGAGGWVAPPPPQVPHQTQVGAVPLASGHTAVDRGQGAAAVNNIAIIHARAGSSSNNHNLAESESKVLPRPLPVDFEDALNMMDD